MKMFTPLFVVCLIATILFSSISAFGQNCSNGTCYRTPVRNVVEGTSYIVGEIVESTVVVASAPVRYLQEVQPVRSVVQSVATGLAQSKAEQQAARGSCCHVGGGYGNARYEGVGFSTHSPEDAVRRCCYYNQRTLVESGVAYGYNSRFRAYGWFACNLYR